MMHKDECSFQSIVPPTGTRHDPFGTPDTQVVLRMQCTRLALRFPASSLACFWRLANKAVNGKNTDAGQTIGTNGQEARELRVPPGSGTYASRA
jgi:hypothetical protein